MDREELIDYLYLRAQECGYASDLLNPLRNRLEEQEMKQLDHLRRISEPAFRSWCTQEENQ
ncbi:MAG: hypothetical protein PF447_10065 [Spirochaetaceae bacterium]|nr:hypothetical protein [Spirochaetaceae bacterium]